MNPLKIKEIPYGLTLLMGVLVWHLNYLVDHETKAPILAYRPSTVETTKASANVVKKDMCYELINLSDCTVFKNLAIDIIFHTHLADGSAAPDPRKITMTPMDGIEVIAPSAIIDTLPIAAVNDEGVRFMIPVMQPDNRYKLHFNTEQNVRADEYPDLYVNSPTAVQLRRYGCREWLIEHIFGLNVILLFVWSILAVIYLIYIAKTTTNENDQNHSGAAV